MTHLCVSKLTIIGSANDKSPDQRQASIWTYTGILLIWPLGTNLSEMLRGFNTLSLKKSHLKVSVAKWRQLCLGLNVLTDIIYYPLLKVRSWNNAMRCMSFYILSMWVSNHLFSFLRDAITHPCLNLNGGLAKTLFKLRHRQLITSRL